MAEDENKIGDEDLEDENSSDDEKSFSEYLSESSDPEEEPAPPPPLTEENKASATVHPFFSLKAFSQGIAAVIVIFLLLTGWIWLRADDTLAGLEEGLSSKTVLIERKPENIVVRQPPSPAKAAAPDQSSDTNKNALAKAPIEGLYEPTNMGPLPKARMEDGLTPFEAYRKPFTPTPGKALIALVIYDIGLSASASQIALEDFPATVSLALSPYAHNLMEWSERARNSGHEIWLQAPIQPQNFPQTDSGPNTLYIQASLEQNQGRLLNTMTQAAGYAGIVTTDDHSFTQALMDGNPLIRQILGRGLGLVNSRTDQNLLSETLIRQNQYPYAENNVWIDSQLDPDAIMRNLNLLQLKAQRDGQAIAFLNPYPLSMDMTLKWISTLDSKAIQLVPLSTIVAYDD